MTIKEFELFHGAVLTKLARSDRPITLRMIETRPNEAWAVYTLNDEIELFIKYSLSPRKLSRVNGALSWQFIFTLEHLEQIKNLKQHRRVFIALVGGQDNIKNKMQVCLLEPNDIDDLLGLEEMKVQSITVRFEPGKKMRVISGRKVEKLVSQNAMDKWIIPGS